MFILTFFDFADNDCNAWPGASKDYFFEENTHGICSHPRNLAVAQNHVLVTGSTACVYLFKSLAWKQGFVFLVVVVNACVILRTSGVKIEAVAVPMFLHSPFLLDFIDNYLILDMNF